MTRALHGLSLAALLCLSAPAGVGAIDLIVNQDQIYRAIAIGRSTAADRAQFHRRYLAPVEDATIERLDVLTAFRRIVIETERRVERGDHTLGARLGADLIKPWRTKLTIVLRLRFHPQNAFVLVPAYEITLGSPSLAALDVRRTPLWAPPASNQKRGAAVALVGAIVETDFDATEVGQTTRVVTVRLDGAELARATIDFAQIQ